MGYFGYNAYVKGGLGFRLPGYEFEKYAQEKMNQSFGAYGSAQQFIDQCDFIYAKKVNTITSKCHTKDRYVANQVLLWGDSYAQMLTYGLLKNLPTNWQLLQIASRGCQVSIFQATWSDIDYCRQSNYFAMKTIAQEKPKVVIVSQNSDLNQENAQLLSDKLHRMGVERVIFVGKPPEWSEPLPKLVFRRFPKQIPVQSLFGLDQNKVNSGALVSAKSLGLSKPDIYLNLLQVLCTSNGCLVYVGSDPEQGIAALDERHLTPVVSNFIAENYLLPSILSK